MPRCFNRLTSANRGTCVAVSDTLVTDFLTTNLDALRARHGCVPSLPAGGDASPVRLHSRVDPVREANDWLDARCGSPLPAAIVVVGAGHGYVLDAIERRGDRADVVIVEPRPSSAHALLSRRDWSNWIAEGRLTLLVGPDYPGAAGAWRPATVAADGPPVLVHPVTEQICPDETTDARRRAAHLIKDAQLNAEARRQHAGRYLRQTLINVPRILREGDAGALDGAFAGVPAIVAAAGPSLNASFGDIALVAEHALLISCDTATRPLLSVGLQPHFIVALDPSESNAMHLSALHPPGSAWLVAEGSVHPMGFSQFDGRTFTFRVSTHHPWPLLNALGVDRAQLAAWGSVATTALDLAVRLGCNPIIFVGFDLAFTNHRPYCRGTIFEAQWASWVSSGGHTYEQIWSAAIDRWPATVERDIYGHEARTAPHLVAFRDWLRQRIVNTPSTRFVNATPGGILHHETIVLASAAATLANAPILTASAIEQQTAARHRPNHDTVSAWFRAVDALTSDASRSEWNLWNEFSAGTPGPAALHAALRSHEHDAWRRGREDRTREGR